MERNKPNVQGLGSSKTVPLSLVFSLFSPPLPLSVSSAHVPEMPHRLGFSEKRPNEAWFSLPASQGSWWLLLEVGITSGCLEAAGFWTLLLLSQSMWISGSAPI